MPRESPFAIVLSKEERVALEAQARQYTSPYCNVVRAKIVLLAAEGLANDIIAARLDTPRQIVSKWRKRFALARLPGLESQPRGGRPALFSPSVVVQIKALACELQHRLQLPLSQLSLSEIRREVISQGLVAEIERRCAPPLATSQLDLPTRPRQRLGVSSICMIAFGRDAL